MQVFYAPEVAAELADAHDWYETRAVGLEPSVEGSIIFA
jgi:hypothetical protein